MSIRKFIISILALCIVISSLTGCSKSDVPIPDEFIREIEEGNIQFLPTDSWGDYFERSGENVVSWANSVSDANVPSSMIVSWGNIGGVLTNIYDDEYIIISTFNALASLKLGKEQGEASDNDIGICFVMRDGTKCTFSFNCDNATIYEKGSLKCYAVELDNDLETLFRETRSHKAGETYNIKIVSGEDFVVECPDNAESGTDVTLSVCYVTDGEVVVYVNGYKLGDECFTDECVVFTMPCNDVKLKVKFSDESYTGA